jgi:tetratricopeptide (TPR) repeat protein
MASLQEQLFEAIVAGDAAKAEAICRAHRDEIVAAFPDWCKIPEALRHDQDGLQRYGSCVIITAQLFAERLGDSSLMEKLRGDDDNPLAAWHRELAGAREEMTAMRYEDAAARLRKLVEETRALSGNGAEHLRAVTLGFLGECAFQQGDAAAALAPIEQALTLCDATGDNEGVIAYLGNLYELHRYLGQGAEAAAYAEQLAVGFEQLGRKPEAARYRTKAAIARAGEPRNRINVVLEDGRQVELDQVGEVGGRMRFVFERDRVSLRKAAELCRRGEEAGSAGRLDEALALFRAAAAADPHDPQPRYEEGVTLLALRRYAEAVEAYAATEELAPGWFHCRADLWLARELAAGRAGHATFEALRALEDGGGEPAAKLAIADAAIAEAPGVAALHYHRGRALEQLGRGDDAFAALGAGIACDPEPDIRTRLLVQMALLLEGNQRAALLEEARTLNGNLVAGAIARLSG